MHKLAFISIFTWIILVNSALASYYSGDNVYRSRYHQGPQLYPHQRRHYYAGPHRRQNQIRLSNEGLMQEFRNKRGEEDPKEEQVVEEEEVEEQPVHSNNRARGRGFLKAVWDTPLHVVSSLLDADPLGAVVNLVGGVLEARSEAASAVGRFMGAVQKGATDILAKELNDFHEPIKMHIRYLLFTQKNKVTPQLMNLNGDVDGTNYDKTKGLKVLIHGFSPQLSSLFDTAKHHVSARTTIVMSVLTMKHAYLTKQSEDNIIVVDWTSISATIDYAKAAAATRVVGNVTYRFFRNLYDKGNLDPAKVHIIGFSLGAQVSGTIGRLFHEDVGDKISRITGLDPAGPMFDLVASQVVGSSTAPNDLRFMLDKGDAKFVDIIHSNGQLGGLGMVSNTGHANFHPNSGASQPGCFALTDAPQGCSHSRAWQMYAESVANKKYPACKCGSWDEFKSGKCQCEPKDVAYMGDPCESNVARGNYYLDAPLDDTYDLAFIEECEKEENEMFKEVEEKSPIDVPIPED